MTDLLDGTARLRRKAHRRRFIAVSLMIVAALYGILSARLAGQPRSLVFLTLVFFTMVAIGGALSWRDRDEVERQEAVVAFAASGFSLLFLFPLVGIVQPVLHLANPVTTLGATCTLIGLATWIVRRLRG